MAEANLEDLKIMLVEPHRSTRRVLESVTAALRIRAPRWLEDPVEGLAAIKQDVPDLLILGQGLGAFDSLDLVERIRQDPHQPYAYLPIIFMTDDTGHQAQEALERGVHTVLSRPISPDSLRDTISSVVDRPLPFVKTGSYFGPDRRLEGPERHADRRSRSNGPQPAQAEGYQRS